MSTKIDLLIIGNPENPELRFYYDYQDECFVLEDGYEGRVLLSQEELFILSNVCNKTSFKIEFGIKD
jgi:hypothetical protein